MGNIINYVRIADISSACYTVRSMGKLPKPSTSTPHPN